MTDPSPADLRQRRAKVRARILEGARDARLAFPKGYEERFSPAQMQVLQAIAHGGPTSGASLAAYLALDDTTVAGALQRLIERNLVADAPSQHRRPGQNRMRERSLTDRGRALADRHADYAAQRLSQWSAERPPPGSRELHSRYDG